ncbi:glycoside hydrolase family 73 protein [Paenibacillus senegalimassiliensis]|uniref:glycoside hydrolase family 73 protein n=1 Tax=Paenibacillus senegalimassiliensis TaxID=1737426 RepID=UPI00073F4323|nr:glucosaminidase domain-containing protein [Paenibacillus senegalimassiliensis]
MNRNEFVAALAPAATANAAKSGIPASLILAQAILESNWGTSKLSVEAKNLFGMKGSGPLGSILLPTTEYRNGQPVRVNASFRKYRNWAESLADHTILLSAKRYAAVVNKSGPEAARAVAAAGYATDPLYANKLIRLMSDYQLTRYDPPKGDDPMTPEEKKQFEALRQTVTAQAKRIAELEKFTQPGIPEWAKEAVAAAVSYSRNEPLLNNPEQGSVDFYRLITVMHRRGLFNR